MYTITLDKMPPGIPNHFSSWEDLKTFVENKSEKEFKVELLPLEEEFLTPEIIKKAKKVREEFDKNPDSFFDLR